MTRFPTTPPLLAALAMASICALSAAEASAPPQASFRFERVNGTYEGSAPELAPIENGPVVVRPSSPAYTLTLVDHRLGLARRPGSAHRLDLEVEIEGRADVVADISIGSFPSRLEDEVELPRQRLRVRGEVTLERQAEGYLLTVVELPRQLEIDVRSRLGGQLVGLCEAVSLFVPGSNCGALERALARVKVRLPEPGDSHLLLYDDLTPEERAALDAYLGPTG